MGNVFFTADLHFDHKNIIEYCQRPYKSVQEMNEALIANWNDVVNKGDEVYILGDFSLSTKNLPDIATQLNGHKYLIPGNHDSAHPMRSKAQKERHKYEAAGIEVMGTHTYFPVPGTDPIAYLALNHFPYKHLSGDDPRYPELRPLIEEEFDNTVGLLHGHCHLSHRLIGNCLNVGVDVHGYKPISLEDVLKELKSGIRDL
jgi:calcineurin-like phosphoesterase family protein